MCGVVGVLTVLLLLPTQYTLGEIVKMWCQEFDIYLLANNYTNIYIDTYITLSISDMDILYQFNLRLHHFWGVFFNVKKMFFQKLTGLWLVGEVVNHVGLYRSKVAEGCSAFQRRSWTFYVCTLVIRMLHFFNTVTACFNDIICMEQTWQHVFVQWVSAKYERNALLNGTKLPIKNLRTSESPVAHTRDLWILAHPYKQLILLYPTIP